MNKEKKGLCIVIKLFNKYYYVIYDRIKSNKFKNNK